MQDRLRAPGSLRRGAGEALALVLVCLVTWFALSLAMRWTPRYPVDLSIKEPETRLELAGFHIPESNGEFQYRWSQPYAFLQLQHAAGYAPGYLASLRLRVPAPDPSRQLTFLLNERPIAITTPSAAFRIYRLALPADQHTAALRLGLQAPELRIPGDARPLGVVLTGAEISPWRVLPPGDTLVALAGVLALWLILRLTGSGVPGALAVCGLLGLALAGLTMLSDPSPLGTAWLMTLTLAGAAQAALLVRRTAARLGLGVLAGLITYSGSLRPSWLTDDAFISFRYAQNLAEGHGLVYNIGERVEGFTNFLWTMLAALVLWLGGDIVWWSYLSGIILALLIMLSAFALARRFLGIGWGLAAALIVATSQSLLIHTARGAGLETGLFTLLVLLGSLFYLTALPVPGQRSTGRGLGWILAGLLFGLATLTRPEGLLLFGLTGIHLIVTTWLNSSGEFSATGYRLSAIVYRLSSSYTPILRMASVYALIVIPFFLWRYGYYGDLLPNTFYAKTGGGLRAALRGLTYSGGFALAMGGPFLLLALVRPPVAEAGRLAGSWRSYLLMVSGVYTLYIVAVGGDHFPGERFFVTLVPWLAVLIAGGLSGLYARMRGTRLRLLAAPLLALVLIGAAGYSYTRATDQDQIVAGSDESLGIWREIGWWLADNSQTEQSVAAMSAGAIAFYSERTTIDMLGLTDRHIARVVALEMGEGAAGHEKRDPAYVLDVRQPTYIPQMWEDYFGGADALRGRYQLITITTRYGREIGMWQRT